MSECTHQKTEYNGGIWTCVDCRADFDENEINDVVWLRQDKRIKELEAENKKYSAGMQENCQLRKRIKDLEAELSAERAVQAAQMRDRKVMKERLARVESLEAFCYVHEDANGDFHTHMAYPKNAVDKALEKDGG